MWSLRLCNWWRSMIRWCGRARDVNGHLLRNIRQIVVRFLNIRLLHEKYRSLEDVKICVSCLWYKFLEQAKKKEGKSDYYELTIWWMWCGWLPSSTLSCDESCGWGVVVSVLMLSLIIFAWLTFCDRFVGIGTPKGSNCMLILDWPSMLLCSSDVRSVDAEPDPD